MATVALLPSALMRCTVRCRLSLPSQWTRNESEPAAANSSRKKSGSEIIRCVSRGRCVTRRRDWTIAGPMERFGTKCPSITSTWIRSAPACSASATCWPRRAKSAARIEGASFTVASCISPSLTLAIARSSVGRVKDALNRCVEQGVELGFGLLGGQPLDQRPRKARHHAVIPPQARVAFFPCIAARQRNYPHHLGMTDALGVEVVFLRQGELEHDSLALRQSVELLEDGRLEELFGLGLFRAVDIHFRLDDGHEARGDDLPRGLELLGHDVRDARSVRLLDHRSHLGSEYPLRFGLVEQRSKAGHRLHQLDTALFRGQALIHFEKRHHPFHIPQIVRGRLPLDLPIHGVLEQDGGENALPGERGAGHDARAHLMHDGKHLLLVGPRLVLDSVGTQGAGRAPAALIERGDEPGMSLHLLQLFLEVIHLRHLVFRYRRMRVLVELSWPRVGSVRLSSSGMMRWASTLPSSTPHWSNESTSQIAPWENTLCSYSATSLPSVSGVSRSARIVFEGRLPRKTRCGTRLSGVPSARTSSRVLPNASASVCANTFAISTSWCRPNGFSARANAMKSHGIRRVP